MSAMLLVAAAAASTGGCSGGGGGGAEVAQGTIGRGPSPAVGEGSGATSNPGAGNVAVDDRSPAIHLSARDAAVDKGRSNVLSWRARNVTSCQASGGWSGALAIQGSARVRPIARSTTYTLTCSGPRGSAVSMLTVDVYGKVVLKWRPPQQRADGSSLKNLASYRIHYGKSPRRYDETVVVNGPKATERTFTLTSGTYYFAMTAVDANGLESDNSNEVVRRID
jgi:hypothetical protein